MASTTPSSISVMHEPYAKRMKQACDAHPDIPALNDGRLTWLRQKMDYEGHAVSLQTVMRWYYGAAMPRQKKLISLAKVLGVTPAWLSLGREEPLRVDTSARHINPEGAVNALAGHMQLAGIPCAFPEPDDPRAEHVHFYSIVLGRQHPIYVAAGYTDPKSNVVRFQTPAKAEKTVVMLVTAPDPKRIEVWVVPHKLLDAGQRDGEMRTHEAKVSGNAIVLNRTRLVAIEDFSKPITN